MGQSRRKGKAAARWIKQTAGFGRTSSRAATKTTIEVKKKNKNKKHLTKDLPEMLFNVLVYTQLRKQTRSDLGIISRPLRFIEINFKQRKIT